jgi:hypothetical protein
MEIVISRKWMTAASTTSQLTIDGQNPDGVPVFVIEDKVREIAGRPVKEWKVPGQTAIPTGRYRVVLTMSNRFGKILPEVLNVPGFSGIRIHPGNTAADTEGCLLPGLTRANDFVGNSRAAFEIVNKKISAAIASGAEVWLTIG